MKKLFDETNEFEAKYYRTIWYGYIDNEFAPELSDEIKQLNLHIFQLLMGMARKRLIFI